MRGFSWKLEAVDRKPRANKGLRALSVSWIEHLTANQMPAVVEKEESIASLIRLRIGCGFSTVAPDDPLVG